MANENIITQISRKNATGFDAPFSIGSEAKYIAGVRGSHVNNIEENFLLGMDLITTEDNPSEGVIHILEEYRTDDILNDYYFVDKYIFENYSAYKRYFYGETLFLPEDLNDNDYNSTSETLIGKDTLTYTFVGDTFQVTNNEPPIQDIIIQSSILKYKNGSGTVIPVAQKTVFAKVIQGNKVIQKTVIRNLL